MTESVISGMEGAPFRPCLRCSIEGLLQFMQLKAPTRPAGAPGHARSDRHPIGLRYRTMRRLPSPTSTARRKPSASSSTLWCEVAACQSKRPRCGRKEHHSNDGIVMLPALREKIASTAAFSVENLLKIK